MDLYASVRVKLGFSDTEFWRSTPAIVSALVKQYDIERDFFRYQTGILASTLINVVRSFGSSKDDPMTPEMFVPRLSSISSSHAQTSSSEVSEEEKLNNSLAFIEALNMRMSGIDLRNEDKAE